jgi:hypothetical protein
MTRDRELIRVGWLPLGAHVAATSRNLAISAPRDESLHAALTNRARRPICKTAPNRLICIRDYMTFRLRETTPSRRYALIATS